MKCISTDAEEKIYRIAKKLEADALDQSEIVVWTFARIIINQLETEWFQRAKEYHLVFGAAFSSTNN